uniref:Uncharacterized protein n=1 Tax=Cacopsylla melanoneura TaxID=428564 RepID=A0A8D8VIS1_9HEMI
MKQVEKFPVFLLIMEVNLKYCQLSNLPLELSTHASMLVKSTLSLVLRQEVCICLIENLAHLFKSFQIRKVLSPTSQYPPTNNSLHSPASKELCVLWRRPAKHPPPLCSSNRLNTQVLMSRISCGHLLVVSCL